MCVWGESDCVCVCVFKCWHTGVYIVRTLLLSFRLAGERDGETVDEAERERQRDMFRIVITITFPLLLETFFKDYDT